jgi:hypothetical protein
MSTKALCRRATKYCAMQRNHRPRCLKLLSSRDSQLTSHRCMTFLRHNNENHHHNPQRTTSKPNLSKQMLVQCQRRHSTASLETCRRTKRQANRPADDRLHAPHTYWHQTLISTLLSPNNISYYIVVCSRLDNHKNSTFALRLRDKNARYCF